LKIGFPNFPNKKLDLQMSRKPKPAISLAIAMGTSTNITRNSLQAILVITSNALTLFKP
jgi:hypothetical protein